MEKIKTKTVISDTIDNWLISTKGRDKNAQIYQLTQLMQPYLAMILLTLKCVLMNCILSDCSRFEGSEDSWRYCPSERKRIDEPGEKSGFWSTLSQQTWQRVGLTLKVSAMSSIGCHSARFIFLVHRVGRTGRNGPTRYSITLYQPSDDSRYPWVGEIGNQVYS